MTFARVDIWNIKTGRLDEFKRNLTDVNAQAGRFGGSKFRLVEMGEGVDGPGLYYTAGAWQNAAAYGGQFSDKVRNDSEWNAVVAPLLADDGPAAWQRVILLGEIIGDPAMQDAPVGAVRVARGWKVASHHEAAFIQGFKDLIPYVQRRGGTLALYRSVIGGTLTSTHYTAVTYPNAATAGAALDALYTAEELPRIFGSLIEAGDALTQTFSRIDYVVH